MTTPDRSSNSQNVSLPEFDAVVFDNAHVRTFLALVATLLLLAFLAFGLSSAAQARGPQSVADLAEDLLDTVVNISTSKTVSASRSLPMPNFPPGSPFRDFFEDFLERQQRDKGPRQRRRRVRSLGSGFILDASGIIVTNNHVIADATEANGGEIVVSFTDNTKADAKVIGRDPKTDIALLQVEIPEKLKGKLKAIRFGDSTKLRVGDWVMAIGNPFGLGGSVTAGIVSARKRDINSGPYDSFIQTDAAINRGNSGGPLFNMEGEVIGINTAIISPSGGSIGIGFSIPASLALPVIEQLREHGETRRGWLGVRIQTVTDEIAEGLKLSPKRGALVADVIEGGPGEEAGVLAGDVILKFNGRDVPQMRDLPRIVADTPIGRAVDVVVLRKGKEMTLKVKVGRLEEGEKKMTSRSGKSKTAKPEEASSLGLKLAPLDDALRTKYKINKDVNGVVITGVDPTSTASERQIRPGEVIVEVGQEKVKSPQDVLTRVEELKRQGLKSILLLLASASGELRFSALRVDDKDDNKSGEKDDEDN